MVYCLYRFFNYTFFECVCTWLEAVPGRTVELRMFGSGLLFTDEPANLKAIQSTEVQYTHSCLMFGRFSHSDDSGPALEEATSRDESGETC